MACLRASDGVEAGARRARYRERGNHGPPRSEAVPLPEGSSYLGFIFARAGDPADVEAALRAAHRALHFEFAPLLELG